MLEKALLTSTEAAKYLKASPRTLDNWRSRGTGPPFIRLSSRAIRYRMAELEAWIEERLQTSTGPVSGSR